MLDPLKLPTRLQTALQALYGHYEKTFELWRKKNLPVPPCFIIVCQNTAISKLVYDYVSGFYRQQEDGSASFHNGIPPLFRNFDETTGNPLPRPNALLIDSEQLEAGDAGAGVDMTLDHLDDLRQSSLLFALTKHLLYSKFRDPGEEPKLHLFGQLKRITKQWLDACLQCRGGIYPGLLMYQELAEMACNRINAGITRALKGRWSIEMEADFKAKVASKMDRMIEAAVQANVGGLPRR